MSKEDSNLNAGTDGDAAQTGLKLDDVDFPGQATDVAKAESGSGSYIIYIPSTAAYGNSAEYSSVLALVDNLNGLENIGSVTKIVLTDGTWNINFAFKVVGKLTNALVKAAFSSLNPVVERADILRSGFVDAELPSWRFMEGTKVLKRGTFIKKVQGA